MQFLASGQETSKADLDLETAYLDAQLQKYIGNSDLQKEKLLACIETDRSNSTLQYQLARIYVDEKDYRNALTFANKAAKLDNTNKWFFLLVADINEILLDYTAANTALANAIAIDARNPILQYRIAHNYQKNQDFDPLRF